MALTTLAHEQINHEKAVKPGSNRTFGIVLGLFFAIISLAPLLKSHPMRIWPLPIALVFWFFAALKPSFLSGPNYLWTQFGLLLSRITNPIIMAILFFGVITPIGILQRLTGSDSLRLKWQKDVKSYWILRDPPGPPPETMRRQF